eukprot:303897-Pyramimonas_sp.AAC.1
MSLLVADILTSRLRRPVLQLVEVKGEEGCGCIAAKRARKGSRRSMRRWRIPRRRILGAGADPSPGRIPQLHLQA